MKLKAALLATALVCAALVRAEAVEPVGAPAFNIKADFDLKSLTTANFYDVLVPVAKKEGTLVFYDFSETHKAFFDMIRAGFESKYGVTIDYHQVDGEQAVQQLIAAKQAGQPSPVDVFFEPNGTVRVADQAGIIANLPLNKMLPTAQDLDENAATVSRGYIHSGKVLPYHRNQTAIAFDTRLVPEGSEPKTLAELLAFAKANPQKVAITDPTKGGSGTGFLETAILALTTKDCQARLYDYTLSPEDATAWAEGKCFDPVISYFKQLKPYVEFTNGNSDTLNLFANGEISVGTVWEDMVLDFIGRGLLSNTVKSRLLTQGEVGDGDGIMIPWAAAHPAAALLFADYLMSDDVQMKKLGVNGSRSARKSLDPRKALSPDIVARLVPQDQYSAYARPRIVGTASDAASARFVRDILQAS